jgi:hypothetical protein
LPVADKQQQIKFLSRGVSLPFALPSFINVRVLGRKNSIKFHMLYRCEHPIFLLQATTFDVLFFPREFHGAEENASSK